MSPCTAPLCLYRFLLCFLLPSSDELENRLLEKVETTFYDTSSKKPTATVQPFMSSLIVSLAASGTSLRLTPSGRPRPAPASTGSWLLQVILSLGTVLVRGAWGWGCGGVGLRDEGALHTREAWTTVSTSAPPPALELRECWWNGYFGIY